jgi:hypothetical protein
MIARALKNDGKEALTLVFEGVKSGTVRLSKRAFSLHGGECIIDICLIDDGEVNPILTVGGQTVKVEKFYKEGRLIRLFALPDSEIRSLAFTCLELQAELTRQREITDALKSKIESATIL